MLFKHWLQRASSETSNEILIQVAGVLADRIVDPSLRDEFTSRLRDKDFRYICEFAPDYTQLDDRSALSIRQYRHFSRSGLTLI